MRLAPTSWDVSYEEMATVWPSGTGLYADVMNEIPKVVFSTTLTRADWAQSRIASGDLADDIDQLKREPGGVIVAHGGARFIGALIRENLIDEYRLVIHPVVIGHGTSLFAALRRPLRFEVVEARTLPSGTMLHTCRPLGAAGEDLAPRPARGRSRPLTRVLFRYRLRGCGRCPGYRARAPDHDQASGRRVRHHRAGP